MFSACMPQKQDRRGQPTGETRPCPRWRTVFVVVLAERELGQRPERAVSEDRTDEVVADRLVEHDHIGELARLVALHLGPPRADVV